MAKPLSGRRLVKALRKEGVTVTGYRSWRRHHRNSKGAWGPVHGVMLHHTATSGREASVRVCYEGRADLPGPLCHGVIDRDGVVHMVGNGRTNHAGLGDANVLQAVIAERSLPPVNDASVDGNARFYGFECINRGDGEQEWPAAQLDAMVRVAAAICRAHHWTAPSVIGHVEWQPGKVDPRGVGMASLRSKIAARLS